MYDNPITRYSFPATNFGAGADIPMYIKAYKSGWIWDVGVFGVTTAFAGSTSTPGIKLGTDADVQAYLKPWSLGALTVAGGGLSLRGALRAGSPAWKALMVNRRIPAGSILKVTLIVAVGAPAGVGNAYVDIAWDR